MYTIVWLAGTGFEICPDGNDLTVSAYVGPGRAVYTLVLLTGTGIEICQDANDRSRCLHWSRTCSCLHGS